MANERELKELICEIGRRIYDRKMVAANDGNISVKLDEAVFLCTPTGVSKGFMTPDQICTVDEEGNLIHANEGFRPSSELKMHMRVYQRRPDIGAVVHAHPPFATAFAVAGIPLDKPIMTEAVVSLGFVPIAEYATPSTTEVPDSLEKYLPYYDALLLESHGALTFSTDLLAAYYKMESVEFYAELMYRTTMLGGPKELDEEKIKKLYEVRRQSGMPGRHPATMCLGPDGECADGSGKEGDFRKLPGYQYDFVGQKSPEEKKEGEE